MRRQKLHIDYENHLDNPKGRFLDFFLVRYLSMTFLLCSWLCQGFRKIIFVFRTKSLNASQFISQFSTTTAFIWDCICFFLWYFSNHRLLSWTTSFRSSCQLESLLASPTLNKFNNTTYTAHIQTTALGKISFHNYSMSRAFVPYFWEYAILKK